MNLHSITAFLLPALTSSLFAQQLEMTSTMSPRGYQIGVHNAAPGSAVFLVLGMDVAAIRLPGGQVLGVSPDVLLLQVADATGSIAFAQLPLELADVAAFVQAAAVNPRLPLEGPGGIKLSDVQRL